MVKELNGCEYGRQNRLYIENIKTDFKDISGKLSQIQNKNEEMFNHFTEKYEEMFKRFDEKYDVIVEKTRDRLPLWVTVLASLMASAIVGLAVYVITH